MAGLPRRVVACVRSLELRVTGGERSDVTLRRLLADLGGAPRLHTLRIVCASAPRGHDAAPRDWVPALAGLPALTDLAVCDDGEDSDGLARALAALLRRRGGLPRLRALEVCLPTLGRPGRAILSRALADLRLAAPLWRLTLDVGPTDVVPAPLPRQGRSGARHCVWEASAHGAGRSVPPRLPRATIAAAERLEVRLRQCDPRSAETLWAAARRPTTRLTDLRLDLSGTALRGASTGRNLAETLAWLAGARLETLHLNVSDTCVGDGGLEALASRLLDGRATPRLRRLELGLRHVGLGPTGLTALLAAIRRPPRASPLDRFVLDLSYNPALVETPGPWWARLLPWAAGWMARGGDLRLRLCGLGLLDAGLAALAQGLVTVGPGGPLATLVLELYGNDIRDRGAQSLAEALRWWPVLPERAVPCVARLTRVNLCSNRIQDAGALAWAGLLRTWGGPHRRLALRWNGNRLGPVGLQALRDAALTVAPEDWLRLTLGTQFPVVPIGDRNLGRVLTPDGGGGWREYDDIWPEGDDGPPSVFVCRRRYGAGRSLHTTRQPLARAPSRSW